jgi:hypothetical protein
MTSDRTISTILRSTLSLLNYYDVHSLGGRSSLTDLKSCLNRAILEQGGDEAKASDDIDIDGFAMCSIRNRSVAIFPGALPENH